MLTIIFVFLAHVANAEIFDMYILLLFFVNEKVCEQKYVQ